MPTRSLMGVAGVLGQKILWFCKENGAAGGAQLFQKCFGRTDADIRRENFAAGIQPVAQVVAGLGALQGQGYIGLYAMREGLPGEAGEAGRDIHGNDFCAMLEPVAVHALDERGGVARRGARKPGAEQGIYPDVGALEAVHGNFAHARLPRPAQVFNGVCTFRFFREHEGRVAAAPLEQSRCSQSVAAVAAGAAGEEAGFPWPEAFFEQSNQCGGGALHHVDGFDAFLREVHLLHGAHLFRRQKRFPKDFHAITSAGRTGRRLTHIHTTRARTRRPPARPLFFPLRATKARRPRGNPALRPRVPRF